MGRATTNSLKHRQPSTFTAPPAQLSASLSTPSSSSPSSLSSTSPPFSLWSPNPERARGEQFFLCWSLVWVSLMAYIVYSRWFESFTAWHYLAVGLLLSLTPILVPLLLPSLFLSSHLPPLRRYTTKANLYVFILAWNANYFWTHYFYSILHASYTFPAHRLNDVPFALYLITHSYFHLYHALACVLLRLCAPYSILLRVTAVLVFAYVTAFMETFTIQHFPYYDIPDRRAMYAYGSVFYGLYFVVSYPMFYQLDERGNAWTWWRTVVESMGCSMLITTLLDAWRLGIGQVTDRPSAHPAPPAIPFIR